MNTLKKLPWLAVSWLLLGLSFGAQATPYDDFLNRDAWWQDRTPSGPITPPPGVSITPNGWEHFYPINVPSPTAWGAGNTLVTGVTLNSMGIVNGKLMQKYTCDGEGLSLPVNWSLTTEQACAQVLNKNVTTVNVLIPNAPNPDAPNNVACICTVSSPVGATCTVPTCSYDVACEQNDNCSATLTAATFKDAAVATDKIRYQGCITAPQPEDCDASGFGSCPTGAEPSCCTNCGGGGQPSCFAICGTAKVTKPLNPALVAGDACPAEAVQRLFMPNRELANNPALLDNTTNFALLLKDRDAGGFHQWAAYNIPFKTNSIGENTPKQVFADLFFQAINDYGYVGYGPPCPITGTHTYDLTLVGLRTPVNNIDAARYTAVQLEKDIAPVPPATAPVTTDTPSSEPRQTPNGSVTLSFTYTRGGDDPFTLFNASPITLTGGDFTNGGWLPSQYTCDGPPEGATAYTPAGDYRPPAEADRLNNPPSLSWQYRPATQGLDTRPAGTRSYVMLARDLTAHDPNGLWVVYDIPNTASSLTGHAGVGITGRNDWGGIGYRGPCPNTGEGLHYIEFYLYAMDVPSLRELDPGISIDQRNPSTFKQVETLVHNHFVAKAQLLGLYGRPQSNGLFRITSPAFVNDQPLPVPYRASYQFPYYTLDTTRTANGTTSTISVVEDRSQSPMICGSTYGQNVSPPLQWANAPAGTQAYVLVM
ncbi:MAG: hypothetical protein WCP34_11485, partial [Pseudomonadota bacterium]